MMLCFEKLQDLTSKLTESLGNDDTNQRSCLESQFQPHITY